MAKVTLALEEGKIKQATADGRMRTLRILYEAVKTRETLKPKPGGPGALPEEKPTPAWMRKKAPPAPPAAT